MTNYINNSGEVIYNKLSSFFFLLSFFIICFLGFLHLSLNLPFPAFLSCLQKTCKNATISSTMAVRPYAHNSSRQNVLWFNFISCDKTLKSLHTFQIKLNSANSDGQPVCFFWAHFERKSLNIYQSVKCCHNTCKKQRSIICIQERILQTH